MNNITILHLSDIHFKRSEKQTFREDVKNKMLEAIKSHLEIYTMPGFAAVTGDIAFSGKEYGEAAVFFNDLKTILPADTEFLVVPGNHDVDREQISKYFSLHQIVNEKAADGFLEDKKEIQTHINPKFNAFRAFVHQFNPGLYQSEEDYFWVKNVEHKNVSFLGLNSSWACENDDDRNNITLGYPQVMDALGKAKMTNRILLMHHPPFNWLNEPDFNRYSGEIFYNCSLILHGHIHTDKALVFKSPSGSSISLGATASYTGDKEGFIGFQFIEAEFSLTGTAVKVWPYRLDTRDRVRFVPDTHRWEGQESPFFQLETTEKPSKKKKRAIVDLEIPNAYKEWIREFHSTMDIELLAKKGEVVQVSLPEVYIPIETRNPFHKPEMEEKKKRKAKGEELLLEPGEMPGTETETKEPVSIDIEELAARKNRILLRGGAGMGKTTLIKHLAYTISHGTCSPSLINHLPVLIFFKELWLIYNEELQKTKKKMVFEELLKLFLEKCRCGLQWETVSLYLSRQRVLFLMDGLDEVPRHLLPDLVDMIARFQFEHKENRFLLTGRPHGIAGRAEARFGGDLHDIEPISEKMAGVFIDKWFGAVSLQAKGAAKVTSQSLISDIRRHEHISVFTQNPLLLTAVCILYQDGKQIPEQRAELYNRIIDNLLYRRFHNPARPDIVHHIQEFLMNIAFENQLKNRKTMEINEAVDLLKKILLPLEDETTPHYHRRIQAFFNDIEPACGLFNRRAVDESEPGLEFIHLTFQEFLAAKHMVENEIDYTPFLEEGWWEETLLLYAGCISIYNKAKSNRIAEAIIKSGDESPDLKRIKKFLEKREQTGFDGWFTAGYGPVRNLLFTEEPSKIAPPDKVEDRVESLFDPTKLLIDPSSLNRFLSGDTSPFKEMGAPAQLDPHTARVVRELLDKLLPMISLTEQNGTQGGGDLETPFGKVPVSELSEGYKSMLAWLAHLILHLLRAVNWKGNIFEIKGIVLIDEVDLHLHPAWQQRVIPLLRECFPNIQFIGCTHSPMTAGGVDDGDIILLEQVGEEIRVKQGLPSIKGWRADQILTGPLFGLESSRDFTTRRLLEEYKKLIGLPELSKEQEKRLRYLEATLSETIPSSGETEIEREAFRLIEETMDTYLNNLGKQSPEKKEKLLKEIKRQLKR